MLLSTSNVVIPYPPNNWFILTSLSISPIVVVDITNLSLLTYQLENYALHKKHDSQATEHTRRLPYITSQCIYTSGFKKITHLSKYFPSYETPHICVASVLSWPAPHLPSYYLINFHFFLVWVTNTCPLLNYSCFFSSWYQYQP